MSNDLFGSNDPADPWSLPSPKHTWTSDNSIPHNLEEQINDGDDLEVSENQDGDETSLHGSNNGSSENVFEEGRVSTSLNPLDDDTNGAGENNLHKSIWEENPILSEPLSAAATFTGSATHNDLRNGDSNGDFFGWSNSIRNTFNPLARDIITISEIPEKEGLLFKHTNYLVAHLVPLPETDASNDRKVVRRYSDFVWLLEVLLKKYPFRIIPELPPKKIASNSDIQFLERRRRGLTRFINQIMKHPILRSESLVLMFLTVPTDLSSWRKHANYDTTEEFKDVKISQRFLNLWDTSVKKLWTDAQLIIKDAYESWSKLTVLIERFEKRSQQIAQDNERFKRVLNEFKSSTPVIYSVENSDISSINEHLRIAGKHLGDAKQLLDDESHDIESGIVQDFKNYGDYLNSINALFERHERLGGNQIEQLTKKVQFNQQKLNELNGKPDARGVEVDRFTEAIKRDKIEIENQTNRDWLIKESVLGEFVLFQETQYQISKIFQDWVADKLKYSELHSNNWNQLANSLQDIPISRVD